MNKRTWIRWLNSISDKRKSKSGPAKQNRKLVGIVVIGVAFAMCGAAAQAQQQAKVPKIGLLGARPAASSTGLELFRQETVSSAMLRTRT
jgi:ABC-type cobalamin transport system permease subunit